MPLTGRQGAVLCSFWCACKARGHALCRWAGYVSFATTLALMVVGTVVARTGDLPAFKGLDLMAF